MDDLARLMEVLGHEQVDLLGFSTGGQVALLFAEAQPDRIRRLILASTTAYPDTATHLRGWEEYERRVANIPPVDDGLDDLDTTIQGAVHGASTSIWNLDLLDNYRTLLDAVRFSGDWLEPFLTGRLHLWRPEDPVGVLLRLGRPVLILHGTQDMVFPVQTGSASSSGRAEQPAVHHRRRRPHGSVRTTKAVGKRGSRVPVPIGAHRLSRTSGRRFARTGE
jgi:pimeloyl-ACP methyl ester carboxylesterase